MTIIYKDGGELTCSTAEVYSDGLYCDDVYIVKFDEIERIED